MGHTHLQSPKAQKMAFLFLFFHNLWAVKVSQTVTVINGYNTLE